MLGIVESSWTPALHTLDWQELVSLSAVVAICDCEFVDIAATCEGSPLRRGGCGNSVSLMRTLRNRIAVVTVFCALLLKDSVMFRACGLVV